MDSETPRCKARSSRTGERCKRPPIRGGAVCHTHGGATPQVKRKAAERLKALQAPAVDALERALGAEAKHVDRKGRIRLIGPDYTAQTRAATAVFDRTGMGPSHTANVNVSASERLAELLRALED